MNWLKLLTFLTVGGLAACSMPQKPSTFPPQQSDTAAPSLSVVDNLLKRAKQASYPEKGMLLLKAVDKLLMQKNIQQAKLIINSIDSSRLDQEGTIYYKLVNAAFAINESSPSQARSWLKGIDPSRITPTRLTSYHKLMARIAELENNIPLAMSHWTKAAEQNYLSKQDRQQIYERLWVVAMQLRVDELIDLASKLDNQNPEKPWVELAIIYKSAGEIRTQLDEISNWLVRWDKSDASDFLPQDINVLLATRPYQPGKIALMLPLSGQLATAGKAVRDGFISAYLFSLKKMDKNESLPEILIYDSTKSTPRKLITMADAAGVGLIIGPLSRSTVERTLKESHSKTPQLLLNTPLNSPSKRLSNSTYFISLSAEQEAEQAAIRAWEDGFRNPVVLIPSSEWGSRVMNAFKSRWNSLGGKILDSYTYDNNENPNTIAATLLQVDKSKLRNREVQKALGRGVEHSPRRRQDLDMIFMAATPASARQLKPSLNYYYAYDIPVYTTTSIYDGQTNTSKDRDLNGIRFPSLPWYIETGNPLYTAVLQSWPASSGQYGSLYALGIDTWHLYPRLEQLARSPGAQMPGETGLLSIDKKGNVQRKLPWQYFENGSPKILTREISRKKRANSDGMAGNYSK